MNRTEVLHLATQAVADREKSYGTPAENFGRIALLWRAQFGWDVKPADVPQAMVLLKLARERGGHKDDNLVDAAGYAALAGEVA